MAYEDSGWLAGCEVPEAYGAVVAGGGEKLTAVDSDRAYRSHRALMGFEDSGLLAGCEVPEAYGAVVTGGGEKLAAVDGDRAH
jgi:hypothetical protein